MMKENEKLMSFKAPFLEEKMLHEGVFQSKGEFQQAFLEFKQFVSQYVESNESAGMTSRNADTVWHQFILFTREYFKFCDQYVGKYLHHVPRLPSQKMASDAWCDTD